VRPGRTCVDLAVARTMACVAQVKHAAPQVILVLSRTGRRLVAPLLAMLAVGRAFRLVVLAVALGAGFAALAVVVVRKEILVTLKMAEDRDAGLVMTARTKMIHSAGADAARKVLHATPKMQEGQHADQETLVPIKMTCRVGMGVAQDPEFVAEQVKAAVRREPLAIPWTAAA